jgi:repressor LexA
MDKKALHPKQKELLKYIKNNSVEDITLSKMRKEIDTASNNLVLHHLKQLEQKGYLHKISNGSYELTPEKNKENAVEYIRYYGQAQCGNDGIFLDEVKDYIPMYSNMIGNKIDDCFMVEARGLSMFPTISEGDKVIAKETKNDWSQIKNNDMIVCENNEEVKIKRVNRVNDREIRLISDNPIEDTIYVDLKIDDFKIAGKVIQIIKKV